MTRKKQSQTAQELGFARRRSRRRREVWFRATITAALLGRGSFLPVFPTPAPVPVPSTRSPFPLSPPSIFRRVVDLGPGACSQRGKGEGGSDFVPGAPSVHPSHHFASRREAGMRMGVGEGSLFFLSHSLVRLAGRDEWIAAATMSPL